MPYSVDWIAKVVTIPTADLTLVAGTRYSLDMSDFLTEIRRLEWEFDEGLWAPAIVDHTNTRNDFAGVDYAPFDDMINGYSVQFTGAATRIDLLGSNNDVIDVLIPTGISIVPSNSAGLQIVTEAGADPTAIAIAVWAELLAGTSAESLLLAAAASAAAAEAGVLTTDAIVDAVVSRSAYSRRDQIVYTDGNMTARERWFPTKQDAIDETNVTDTFTVTSTVDGPETRVLQTFDKIRDV